jgi:IS30 family transposase
MHPEQGSARLELKGELSLSHETIYQHLCAAKLAGGEW